MDPLRCPTQKLKVFLIAPPFGSRLRLPGFTSVRGTYTVKPRPGLFWRVMKTLRPVKGGWVNQIGYRNPGIDQACVNQGDLVSITALEPGDWAYMIQVLPPFAMVELNISCPNKQSLEPTCSEIQQMLRKFSVVVLKLAPQRDYLRVVGAYYEYGVRTFTFFNTVKIPKGGLSGHHVKKRSLIAIRRVRTLFPDVTLVGLGGMYKAQNVQEYAEAGADHFAFSSLFFNPFKTIRLLYFLLKNKRKLNPNWRIRQC